jgi:hypothetical protein
MPASCSRDAAEASMASSALVELEIFSERLISNGTPRDLGIRFELARTKAAQPYLAGRGLRKNHFGNSPIKIHTGHLASDIPSMAKKTRPATD